MTQKSINLGTADQGNGDPLRVAFGKVNDNFTELYTALGLVDNTLNLGAFEFTGSVISTTDSSAIVIDQAVTVSSNLTVGGDVLPSVANGGDLGSSARPWRSLYVSNNTIYIGGVPLGIDANGNLTVDGSLITGGGGGSSLVNGDSSFSISSDGTLTLTHPSEPALHPLATVLTLQKAAGNYHTISGAYGLSLQATPVPNGSGLNTNTNFVDIFHDGISVNVNDNTWGFGTDGKLTLPSTNIITAALSQQVGTIITDIEAWNWHNGTGNPYAWNQWNPAFLSLYNIGDSIIGWSFYSDADPSNVVTITARNPDISELTFSGDLGSPPYVAHSPDYVSFHGNPVVIQTQGPQFQADWTFGNDGVLTLPNGSTIGDGEAGVGVPITTARGTILLGNLAECAGGESHFHIMPAGQQAIDLFLGDDSNYVKLPSTGGVEISSSEIGAQHYWAFGTDGALTFPNGDLKIAGNTISNYVVGDPGSSGSQLEVAPTKTVITNGVTNSLSEGGPSLISQALFEVSTNGILSSFQTINSLGEGDSTLTSEYLTELDNNSFKIGQRTTNDLGDSSEPLVAFNGWTFSTQSKTLTLPNSGELRPSTAAYDSALAGWESIRGGYIINTINNNLATAEGWPMVNWYPTGAAAQGYIDFLFDARTLQNTPGATLIIQPAMSTVFYNEMRAALIAIRDSYNTSTKSVSLSSAYGKSWNFGADGKLTLPTPAPITFTANLVPVLHGGGGDAWYYTVVFQPNANGDVETMIVDYGTLWDHNPGYESGDSWNFTETGSPGLPGHGIPGYTFTLTLASVNDLGEGEWTADFAVGEGPAYPSTVKSTATIKLSADTKNWTFGTDGALTLPTGGDIVDSNGDSVLGSNANTGNFTFSDDTIANDNGLLLDTNRGSLAIGTNMEVPGVAGHFHIAFNGSNSNPPVNDLFFGDDYNYVKLPGSELDPDNTYGVEIGTEKRNCPQNVVVDAVDELVPPGGVWRLFIIIEDYPNLGSLVSIGDTVTTSWGTPITATVTGVVEAVGDGDWQIQVDQDITAGFSGYDTVSFGRSSYTWRFGTDGELTLPQGGDIVDSSGTSVLGGGSTSYAPDDTDNWNAPTVNTISAALDELAARVTAFENYEIDGGNAYTPALGELLIDGNGA